MRHCASLCVVVRQLGGCTHLHIFSSMGCCTSLCIVVRRCALLCVVVRRCALLSTSNDAKGPVVEEAGTRGTAVVGRRWASLGVVVRRCASLCVIARHCASLRVVFH